MFSRSVTETNSFESSWKSEQEVVSNATQTEPCLSKDIDVQVTSSVDAICQTVEDEQLVYGTPNYNEFTLLDFLKRITPEVEKELLKSQRSRAFVGYSELEDSTKHDSKCIHTLRVQHLSKELVVTCLDWSSTGSLIGVGYGAKFHDTFCYHTGYFAVWNINRPDYVSNAPDRIMEVLSCVADIAFHPSNPAWVAVASISELMVFDLSLTQEATPSCLGEPYYGEITCLQWGVIDPSAPGMTRNSYPLVTAHSGSSGAVLFWNVKHARETMVLSSGFCIEEGDIPRSIGYRLPEHSMSVDITSMTFNYEDPTLFLIGTEGGAILICSTLSQVPSDSTVLGIKLNKCVKSSLGHTACRVIQVEASPHHRHAIQTLSSDNTLRLYSLLEPNKYSCVFHLEDSFACSQWSPSRPLVVAVGCEDGTVSFRNFGTKHKNGPIYLKAAEKASPISSLAFNKKNMNLLAAGDHLGRVFIWEMPDSLISPSPSEQAFLSKILQVTID